MLKAYQIEAMKKRLPPWRVAQILSLNKKLGIRAFDPSQPRAADGKWTNGSGGLSDLAKKILGPDLEKLGPKAMAHKMLISKGFTKIDGPETFEQLKDKNGSFKYGTGYKHPMLGKVVVESKVISHIHPTTGEFKKINITTPEGVAKAGDHLAITSPGVHVAPPVSVPSPVVPPASGPSPTEIALIAHKSKMMQIANQAGYTHSYSNDVNGHVLVKGAGKFEQSLYLKPNGSFKHIDHIGAVTIGKTKSDMLDALDKGDIKVNKIKLMRKAEENGYTDPAMQTNGDIAFTKLGHGTIRVTTAGTFKHTGSSVVTGSTEAELQDAIDKAVPKKTYSPKPDSITQPMHEALEDKGYKFESYGKKTGAPLYKNPEGKAVYVKGGENFEHYPMGNSSNDATGMKTGTGPTELKDALSAPVPPKPLASPFPKTLGVSTPHYPVLKDEPYLNEDFGSVADKVTKVDPAGFSSAEKSAIGNYKGSGSESTNINDHAIKLASKKVGSSGAMVYTKIEALDSAVNKYQTKNAMEVFRGIHGPHAEQALKSLKVGDVYQPHSFQETSLVQAVAHSFGHEGVVLRISVPKGTPVIPTTIATTHFSGEKGMIFSRAVHYTITDVYQSGGQVYMRATLHHNDVKASATLLHVLYSGLEGTMNAEKFTALAKAAGDLGMSADDFETALMEVTRDGKDATPLITKQLRARLERKAAENAQSAL